MMKQNKRNLQGRGDFRREFPRKLIVTGITSILLIMLYGLIFSFSAQDAEQSGSLSQRISYKGAELVDFFSGSHRSEEALTGLAEVLEHPIRKLAHFSEYGCMGILVYLLWCQWIGPGRKRFVFMTGWIFVSAALDEFHQYFVPGRYASMADVLLDTCGGVCGMFFVIGTAAVSNGIKGRCHSIKGRCHSIKGRCHSIKGRCHSIKGRRHSIKGRRHGIKGKRLDSKDKG